MKKVLLTGLFCLITLTVLAHGPSPQKIKETIVIDAAPEAIWKIIGNFGSIDSWHPMVKRSEPDGGHEAGASERKLTLQNNQSVVESLDQYEPENHHLAYRLLEENLEALPVSFYSADMQLTEEGDGTRVVWSARFYRGDTGNFPPEDLNDQAAIDALTRLFQQGLKGLKDKVESGL